MNQIKLVFRKELLEVLRDKKTLLIMTLIPVLITPVFVIGMPIIMESYYGHLEQRMSIVGVVSQNITLINEIYQNESIMLVSIDKYNLQDIENRKFDAIMLVNITNHKFNITIYYKSTIIESQLTQQKLISVWHNFSTFYIANTLIAQGINIAELNPVELETQDIATEEEIAGFTAGMILPFIIVIAGMFSGMYSAIDITAGEKERKTIELLLSLPINRKFIIFGKFITICVISIFTLSLLLCSFAICNYLVSIMYSDSVFVKSFILPIENLLLGIPALLLLIAMFNAIMLSICIRARNYKEAQQYISPLTMAVIFPIILTQMITIHGLSPQYYLIPIMNVILLFKELLMGITNLSHILLTTISTIIYASLALYIAKYHFEKEEVIFRQ